MRAQRWNPLPVPAALLAAALLVCAAASAADAPPVPKAMELGRGPTVVIVHELGGARTSWMPTGRKLIADHRVVLVDLPGHGESALPDPFSLEAAAEGIAQVVLRQNPDSTVIVAKGMGGMLALMALKAHPDCARGILLIDVGLKSPMKIDDQQIQYIKKMLDDNYDGFIQAFYSRAGRDSAEGVRTRALAQQVPPATMKAYLSNAFTADVSQALKTLRVPVLFVGTDRTLKDKDWATVGKEMGYEDPAAVPSRYLAGAGALVMQDMPDSLAAVISRFETEALAAKKK
jgi:pimeloyl-ACP methyl ester carboxylesterase